MTRRCTEAERRYLAIKEGVKGRATTLDEAVSQSAQVRHRGLIANGVLTVDLGLMSSII